MKSFTIPSILAISLTLLWAATPVGGERPLTPTSTQATQQMIPPPDRDGCGPLDTPQPPEPTGPQSDSGQYSKNG